MNFVRADVHAAMIPGVIRENENAMEIERGNNVDWRNVRVLP